MGNPEQYSLLMGRKHARAKLGNVLVLGLGVSGKAAVEYLVPLLGGRLTSLVVLGGKSTDSNIDWAEEMRRRCAEAGQSSGFTLRFDFEDAKAALPAGVSEFDFCIASPGISMFSDFYQNALSASSHVISEVEFAWCESANDSVWVAITGTNGKTTTTALIEHLLQDADLNAKAVGNIGDACIAQVSKDLEEAAALGEGDVFGESLTPVPYYVVETSSYQLASVNEFAPNVAVLLGITPDHIKWHKTHEHYAASKFKLLDNLGKVPGAVAVLDATNDETRAKVRELKAEGNEERGYAYIPIGTSNGVRFDMRQACGADNSAFVDDEGTLTVAFAGREHRLANSNDMQILGVHNQINALAAASAALACGVDEMQLAGALTTFKPLEHRIEPCGVKRGVAYYNDSKATNVDATLQALRAFLPKKPIVMLGGDDKGTDLDELVESCRQNTKALICYGEGGPRFYEAVSALSGDGIEVSLVDSFVEAFEWATEFAQPGDIVLLSPACASFDEFSCFEERGERFKQLVAAIEDDGKGV